MSAPAFAISDQIETADILEGEAPRPLFRELPPAESYPVDALGPTLAKAARAIETAVQCPMATAANSVLATASLAAQGIANVILPIGEGKLAPLSLFMITVSESGERKSTADGMALNTVRKVERDLCEAESAERRKYEISAASYDVAVNAAKRQHKNDRDALEKALAALGPPPPEPLQSVIAPSSDPTYEGLFRIWQHGRPSIGMMADDGASFIGGHSMKAEQRQTTTANLCRAWDGSKIERIRGGDGVTVLYDRRLACHLMIQPGVAAGVLSDDQLADQGLLARFLICSPAGRAGTRIRDDDAYSQKMPSVELDMAGYNDAISNLLRKPIRWKDEWDRARGIELLALPLDLEARALYVAFSNAIEAEMKPNGKLSTLKAFASKLPEQAVRIAAILTLVDDPVAMAVNETMLANGITLAKHYLSEANRLTAAGLTDPSLLAAQRLLDWLHEKSHELIGLKTIYQNGPNGLRDASSARSIMAILVDHGWVEKIDHGTEIEGKFHREAWRVKPDGVARI